MNLLEQCETALSAYNQGMRIVLPLGIYWECKCNLLINCTEGKKRAQLVDADGAYLQIIKLTSAGNICRYWGLQRVQIDTVDKLNAQVVNIITHHLGMRRVRYHYISKHFCGGYDCDDNSLEHAVMPKPFTVDTQMTLGELFADC